MVSGCIDITEIQKNYVADRDSCIRLAQQGVSTYLPDCTDNGNCNKDKANVKNEGFCECMNNRGWTPVRSMIPPYPNCPGKTDTKETSSETQQQRLLNGRDTLTNAHAPSHR